MSAEWAWKDPQQGGLGLRYEPGNWGDILKGEWLCHWLEHWPDQRPLRYIDPFCGQPSYPLSQATRQRIESAPVPAYRAWLGSDELLSSAELVRRVAIRRGIPMRQSLSDRDGDPLKTMNEAGDLLLFDPYDFFESWPRWVSALQQWSQGSDVMIYLYNKSPRGVGQFRNYQALRQTFQALQPWVGRVAADGLLPRAWHEVWLVGPRAAGESLRSKLHRLTLELHHHVLSPGAFE